MTLLIFFVLLALCVSFACSIMEAVLLSVTPAYVAAAQQTPHGKRLQRLKRDVNRPLAAILSLNTMANTVGAAGAGAQAATVFGDAYIGVFSGVLTLLILVLSEVIPKSVGARYWRELAPFVSRVLGPMIWILWPLVKMSELLTRRLSRGAPGIGFQKDELAAMAEIGRQEGVITDGEIRILKNLLRFRTLRVSDIMTPRTVVFAFPDSLTVEEALDQGHLRYSRIPIYGNSLDDVTGYVLKDEILLHVSEDRLAVRLREIQRKFTAVPESMSVPLLFEALLESREHIALVVDEYGGTDGVVTIEDVIETLLGLEIVDEADVAQDMQELARQQWRKRARALGIQVDELDKGK
jgi:CBS domain containing-hemolysin-like protein